MLEKASAEEIAQLRLMPGKEVAVFAIETAEVGTVVRVTTTSPGEKSGNHYLFEVTKPAAHRAHMVRCDPRGLVSAGYLGERVISLPIFRIGDQIFHGAKRNRLANTSAVAGITILQKEVE